MLAVNAFRDDPDVWLIFVVGVRPGLHVVAAAAVPRGADAAHRAPRRAAGGQRADQPGHAARRARRPGGGRPAGRLRRHRLVLPHRHRRARGGVADALRADGHATRTARRPRRRAVRASGQGLSYAFSRRDLLGTYLVDIAAMLLAIPVVLFPALVEEVFEQPRAAGPALLRRDRRRAGRDRPQRLDRRGCTTTAARSCIAAAAYGGFIAAGRADAVASGWSVSSSPSRARPT